MNTRFDVVMKMRMRYVFRAQVSIVQNRVSCSWFYYLWAGVYVCIFVSECVFPSVCVTACSHVFCARGASIHASD